MKIHIVVALLVCAITARTQSNVHIIPQPVSLQEKQGVFVVDNNIAIAAKGKETNAAAVFLLTMQKR